MEMRITSLIGLEYGSLAGIAERRWLGSDEHRLDHSERRAPADGQLGF